MVKIGVEMEEEISQRTVTILVVLTVIISILGTLSVMSAIGDLEKGKMLRPGEGSSQGTVQLEILEPGEDRTVGGATGQVVLDILPSEENEDQEEKAEKPRILLLPESSNT